MFINSISWNNDHLTNLVLYTWNTEVSSGVAKGSSVTLGKCFLQEFCATLLNLTHFLQSPSWEESGLFVSKPWKFFSELPWWNSMQLFPAHWNIFCRWVNCVIFLEHVRIHVQTFSEVFHPLSSRSAKIIQISDEKINALNGEKISILLYTYKGLVSVGL